MRIIEAPNRLDLDYKDIAVFTAGSIENGAAEDWQSELIFELSKYPVTVLNPRRKDWDWTWEQSIDNPKFKEQVLWELEGLGRADVIPLHFCKDTRSPISLLELGLMANSGKLIVYCPEGFWRKGNVDIVCSEWSNPVFSDKKAWLSAIKERISSLVGVRK